MASISSSPSLRQLRRRSVNVNSGTKMKTFLQEIGLEKHLKLFPDNYSLEQVKELSSEILEQTLLPLSPNSKCKFFTELRTRFESKDSSDGSHQPRRDHSNSSTSGNYLRPVGTDCSTTGHGNNGSARKSVETISNRTLTGLRNLHRTSSLSMDKRHRPLSLSISASNTPNTTASSTPITNRSYAGIIAGLDTTITHSETGNLVRIKQSTHGQSVPNLSSSHKDLTFKDSALNSRVRLNSNITRTCSHGRRSLLFFGANSHLTSNSNAVKAITIDDAKDTKSGSPTNSGRLSSFGSGVQVRAENKRVTDTRRWSLASLPSSGYGTLTPTSSNLSSQYSSKENLLHHKHHCSQQPRSPLCGGIATSSSTGQSSPFHSSARGGNSVTTKCISGRNSRNHSPCDKLLIHENRTPTDSMADAPFSSKNLSVSIKPRSQSLNSPCRSPGAYEQDIFILNHVYKERFPKATMQMMDRLSNMLLCLENENTVSWEPISRLVHTQITKHVKDILNMTNLEAITSTYFFELTQNLETLLKETRLKCPESLSRVRPNIQNLLFIIARPARLLECIEFDPKEFYKLLEAAENNLRNVQTDVPKYIISKLGLDKDPYDIGSEELNTSLELNLPLDPSQTNSYNQGTNGSGSISGHNGSTRHRDQSSGGDSGFYKPLAPKESDFEDIKLISNGAYGAVHLVREKKTKKRFAMKKIRKDNLLLRNQVDQIFAERDIMTFADSPFVVGLYCTLETRKYLCMIMEYVEGGDVATLIKSIGPLPDELARMYFAETVLALEYLHNFGIVHRDLKPDNLLITLEGHIKLTDFGLSKVGLMNLTTTLLESVLDKDCTVFQDKQVFGTPDYIAPEVILRQGYDKMIDWWAMGIILYEFVVGCTPFYGDTTDELFSNIVSGDIEWPQEPDPVVADDATDLIGELLKRDPMARLGADGTHEVKEHEFFTGLDWQGLLRQKALFIPVLDHDEDTSYFDPRTSRYQHESDSDECGDATPSPLTAANHDDTMGTDCLGVTGTASIGGGDSSDDNNHDNLHHPNNHTVNNGNGGAVFHAFPSCSPRFSRFVETELGRMTESSSLIFSVASGGHDNDGPATTTTTCTTPATTGVVTMARSVSAAPSLLTSSVVNIGGGSESSSSSEEVIIVSPMDAGCVGVPDNGCSNNCGGVVMPVVVASSSSSSLELSAHGSLAHQSSEASSEADLPVLMKTLVGSLSTRDIGNQAILCTASSSGGVCGAMRERSESSPVHPSPAMATNRNTGCSSISRSKRDPIAAVSPLARVDTGTNTAINVSRSPSNQQLMTPPPRRGSVPRAQSPLTTVTAQSSPSSPSSSGLTPPIVIHRRSRNFGFVIRAIRVFYGESDVYTLHHLIVGVDPEGSAFQAGLREGDLITHINGVSIVGAYHTEVVSMIIQSGASITLRVVPLNQSFIRTDGPWRPAGKMATKHHPRKAQHLRAGKKCCTGHKPLKSISSNCQAPPVPPHGPSRHLSTSASGSYYGGHNCPMGATAAPQIIRRSTEKPLIRQLSEKQHHRMQSSNQSRQDHGRTGGRHLVPTNTANNNCPPMGSPNKSHYQ